MRRFVLEESTLEAREICAEVGFWRVVWGYDGYKTLMMEISITMCNYFWQRLVKVKVMRDTTFPLLGNQFKPS